MILWEDAVEEENGDLHQSDGGEVEEFAEVDFRIVGIWWEIGDR